MFLSYMHSIPDYNFDFSDSNWLFIEEDLDSSNGIADGSLKMTGADAQPVRVRAISAEEAAKVYQSSDKLRLAVEVKSEQGNHILIDPEARKRLEASGKDLTRIHDTATGLDRKVEIVADTRDLVGKVFIPAIQQQVKAEQDAQERHRLAEERGEPWHQGLDIQHLKTMKGRGFRKKEPDKLADFSSILLKTSQSFTKAGEMDRATRKERQRQDEQKVERREELEQARHLKKEAQGRTLSARTNSEAELQSQRHSSSEEDGVESKPRERVQEHSQSHLRSSQEQPDVKKVVQHTDLTDKPHSGDDLKKAG